MNTTPEAKKILEKYFRAKAKDVQECYEMGRGILYFEEDALKAMEEYHSIKCEEAGKEIDYVKFKVAVTDFYGDEDGPNTKCHLGANFSYGYFKDTFFKRLSLLQSQLEAQVIAARKTHQTSLEIIESKDKEIEQLQKDGNFLSLDHEARKFELQEAKAEAEGFRKDNAELQKLVQRVYKTDELKERFDGKSQLSTKDNTEEK